jgi:hypothetical protein
MKKLLETEKPGVLATRRPGIGFIGLILVATAAVLPGNPLFATVSFYAKRVHSNAAAYLRADQWRAEVNSFVTDVEYLFCPESGAGARINLETDE